MIITTTKFRLDNILFFSSFLIFPLCYSENTISIKYVCATSDSGGFFSLYYCTEIVVGGSIGKKNVRGLTIHIITI